MTMSRRPKVPKQVATTVLTKSLRRCCVCFYLRRDATEKNGQIAHVDRDPTNNAADNLVWLCLEHHDKYDTRRSQSKGLTEDELRTHRKALYQAVERGEVPGTPDAVGVSANDVLDAALTDLRAAYAAHSQASLVVVFCCGDWLNEGWRDEADSRRSVDASKCMPGGEWTEDGPSVPKVRAAFEHFVGGGPLGVHSMGEVRDGAYSGGRELSGGAFLLISGPSGEQAAAELIRLSNVLGTLLPSRVADSLGCSFSESPAAQWAAFVLNQPTCEAYVEPCGHGFVILNFLGASLRAFEDLANAGRVSK